MVRTLIVSAALFGAVAPVSAQPAPPPMDDAKKAEAKALYDKGITHYNLGEYDKAIAAFRQAYEISLAPGLLFNIAQAHRLNKDYEQASKLYSTYLRLKPDAPNRADVEARIAEMNAILAQQNKVGDKAPVGTVPPEGEKGPPKPATPTPTDPSSGTPPPSDPAVGSVTTDVPRPVSGGATLKLAGISTAALGGALIITGAIFGSMASGAESDLNGLNNGGTWDQAAQDKYDSGKRNNTIAIACLVTGGLAVVGGGAMWFVGNKKSKESSVAIVPARGGGTFAVGWKF